MLVFYCDVNRHTVKLLDQCIFHERGEVVLIIFYYETLRMKLVTILKIILMLENQDFYNSPLMMQLAHRAFYSNAYP